MPRNRRDVDRGEKIEQILTAAESALLDGGYEALSLSAIARELGLARNAINWYFPTRDHLFTAALTRIFGRSLASAPVRAGYKRRISWAVDQLAKLQPVMMVLHERARHSEVAAELEMQIEHELCARLRTVLKDEVPDDRLDMTARTIEIFVQGLLARPRPAKERQRVLHFALSAIVSS